MNGDDDALSYDELVRIVRRGSEERRLLCQRIARMEGEKAALMAIVKELQEDLAGAKGYIESLEPIPG